MLLAGRRDDNTGQVSDAPGFILAPAKMDGEPLCTVEGVLGVSSTKCCYSPSVLGALFGCSAVVARPTNAQNSSKLVTPSRLDFFQDG